MKYTCLVLAILFISCNSEPPITDSEQKEFTEMAQAYQQDIMQGAEKLDAILAKMDRNLQMWENDKIWTYKLIEEFGPHLPKKEVINVYNEQILLYRDLGYDYVTMLYVSTISGDTLRETASRIWKKTDQGWKVTYMSNLIKRELTE